MAQRRWRRSVDGASCGLVTAEPWSVPRGKHRAYLDESDPDHTESYIGQLKFGTDIWQAGLGLDSEGNWAVEAAYSLNDRTRLRLGYDQGLNGHNGKDRFYSGSPDPDLGWRDALDRGESWEIGLEVKF